MLQQSLNDKFWKTKDSESTKNEIEKEKVLLVKIPYLGPTSTKFGKKHFTSVVCAADLGCIMTS